MTLRGSCENCGAPLASEHHACPICALPATGPRPPVPVILKRAPGGLPIPPQSAVVIALLALGFGGVVGSTLNGGLGGLIASASQDIPAAVAEADTTGSDSKLASSGGDGSSGTPSPGTGDTPVADVPAGDSYVPTLPVDPPLDPPLDPPAKPPKEEADRVSGTVVRVNPVAESYSVATGDGALTTVHAKDLPEAGTEIKAPIETLFNTTAEESGKRKDLGESKSASFSGTVTFVDEKARKYVISSAGSSVVVSAPAPVGQEAPEMPALTSAVTVKVDVTPVEEEPASLTRRRSVRTAPAAETAASANGSEAAAEEAGETGCVPAKAYPEEPVVPTVKLVQDSFEVDFDSLSYASLEGVVQAVCADSSQMVISADDLRELGTDIVLTVPKKIDSSLFEEGESITAALDPEPDADGAHSLWGIASDDGSKGADDENLGQGDLEK